MSVVCARRGRCVLTRYSPGLPSWNPHTRQPFLDRSSAHDQSLTLLHDLLVGLSRARTVPREDRPHCELPHHLPTIDPLHASGFPGGSPRQAPSLAPLHVPEGTCSIPSPSGGRCVHHRFRDTNPKVVRKNRTGDVAQCAPSPLGSRGLPASPTPARTRRSKGQVAPPDTAFGALAYPFRHQPPPVVPARRVGSDSSARTRHIGRASHRLGRPSAPTEVVATSSTGRPEAPFRPLRHPASEETGITHAPRTRRHAARCGSETCSLHPTRCRSEALPKDHQARCCVHRVSPPEGGGSQWGGDRRDSPEGAPQTLSAGAGFLPARTEVRARLPQAPHPSAAAPIHQGGGSVPFGCRASSASPEGRGCRHVGVAG